MIIHGSKKRFHPERMNGECMNGERMTGGNLMKEKLMKKGRLSLALVLIIVLTLTVPATAYARVTITLNKTTMATGMKQRLYISGGTGSVKSSNKNVITFTKDSASVIVYSERSGTARIRCTIGGFTKVFNMTVLTNKQIATRVLKRVQKYYGNAGIAGMSRKGSVMYVDIYKGSARMSVKINLSTGRAVCGSGWSDSFSRVMKSFVVF